MTAMQIDPKLPAAGWRRDDALLRERVVRFLQTRGIQGVDSLLVEVSCGKVILQGRVASSRDRWLLNNCCRRVAGVLRVTDDLQDARQQELQEEPREELDGADRRGAECGVRGSRQRHPSEQAWISNF